MITETPNPATGQVEHRQELMGADAVEAILHAAQTAFPEWAQRSLEQRAGVLHRVGEVLRERREAIAQLMTAEMGKLKGEALAEVDKCAGACDYYAEHAAGYLQPEPIKTEARASYVRYEPIGCVFAVMPWNFPIWQVFRFLAPTLMVGNTALLKHATNVPRCADAIADALRAAGVPEGVFGVLHIDNDQAAEVIRDPRIAAVTLTGSERAGKSIAATAGSVLKKCVMELGGSDAFVVLDDADLDKTVAAAVKGRFDNAGQTCIAAKRFIVVEAIADAFVQRFVEAAGKLQTGDPNDAATTLAPMARQDLRDALHHQVASSVADGARVRAGRQARPGPCRLSGDHPGWRAARHGRLHRRTVRPGRQHRAGQGPGRSRARGQRHQLRSGRQRLDKRRRTRRTRGPAAAVRLGFRQRAGQERCAVAVRRDQALGPWPRARPPRHPGVHQHQDGLRGLTASARACETQRPGDIR